MIKILAVDDEEIIIRGLADMLGRNEDMTVEGALSAEDGLKMLKENAYDAVISDYRLPGMDGIQFLKILRKKHPKMPFVIFTAHGEEKLAIEALNNGADFYLEKNSNPGLIYKALSNEIRIAVACRRAEENHLAIGRKLKKIIEFLPDATFVIDKNMKVEIWNQAMETMTHIKKDEILGKQICRDMLPCLDNNARAVLNDLFLNGGIDINKCFNRSPERGNVFTKMTAPSLYGGRGADINMKVGPYYDENGVVAGAIGTIHDITDLNRSMEKTDEISLQYRHLFNNANDAIFLFQWRDDNKPGKIIDVNDFAISVLGYSREEFLNMEVLDFNDECCLRDVPGIAKQIIEKGRSSFDMIHVARDGRRFLGNVSTRLLTINGRRAGLSIVRYDLREGNQ